MERQLHAIVPEVLWQAFRVIRHVMCRTENIVLPQGSATTRPNCHVVARSLARILPFEVRDGYFATVYDPEKKVVTTLQHSWLIPSAELIADPNRTQFIIDPWPIDVVTGPLMYVRSQRITGLYKEAWILSEDEIRLQDPLIEFVSCQMKKLIRVTATKAGP